MQKFLIRNDDVAFDTRINEIKTFCEICDRHGFKIIQAITPIGECRKVNSRMQNDDIKMASFKKGIPTHPIMYLHSWRFNEGWYTFDKLNKCLERISND